MNDDGKLRLAAVEMRLSGATLQACADQYNVHPTTIGEWVHMYQTDGVERLNTYRKPRPVHHLDATKLQQEITSATDNQHRRLSALLELANGARLDQTAAKYSVTPQGLAKWRREYLKQI